MPDYWRPALRRRLSRRRALSAAAASLAGAALLAACGGGDSSKQKTPTAPASTPGPKDRSGLLAPLVDETKSAKRGGVLKGVLSVSWPSYDPMAPGTQIALARRSFSQLLRIKDGVLENTNGDIEGDVAESWELTPDRLTLILHLSPGAHFAPVPPVNGRMLDASDVLASWQRYKSVASRRGELSVDVSPTAPIVAMASPDDKTVVIRLKEPNVSVLTALASQDLGTLWMLPKEALDPNVLEAKHAAIGSGPFYLSDVSESGVRFKRNTFFKQDKRDLPYVDEIDDAYIADYAAQVAQFRAGSVYQMSLHAEDLLPLKRDVPALEMRQTPVTSVPLRFIFGQNPDSPFRDERVRQAWVRTWNRDAYLDTQYNVSAFGKEGLPVSAAWDGALPASAWKGWWLDPRGADFGPTAVNFRFDVAEARRLLTAAGFPDGLDTELHQAAPGPASYPASYFAQAEPLLAMVRDSGLFRLKDTPYSYATEWTPRIRNARGAFSGVAWWADVTSVDPAAALYATYNSKGGSLFHGSDATLDDLTQKLLTEFDTAARMKLAQEVQRHEGQTMFSPKIGGATGFTLTWPALRNAGVYQGGTNRQDATVFIDPDRAPLR